MTISEFKKQTREKLDYLVFVSCYNYDNTMQNIDKNFISCYPYWDGYNLVIYPEFDKDVTCKINRVYIELEHANDYDEVVMYDYDDYCDVRVNSIIVDDSLKRIILC